jgi:hypothetical protein
MVLRQAVAAGNLSAVYDFCAFAGSAKQQQGGETQTELHDFTPFFTGQGAEMPSINALEGKSGT